MPDELAWTRSVLNVFIIDHGSNPYFGSKSGILGHTPYGKPDACSVLNGLKIRGEHAYDIVSDNRDVGVGIVVHERNLPVFFVQDVREGLEDVTLRPHDEIDQRLGGMTIREADVEDRMPS